MLSPTGDAEEEYLPLRTTPTSAHRAPPVPVGEEARGPWALSRSPGAAQTFPCAKRKGGRAESRRAPGEDGPPGRAQRATVLSAGYGGRGGSEKRCAVRCLGGEVLQPLFQRELRLGDILRIIDVNDVKAAGIDVETVVAIGARRRFRVPDAHLREHRFRLEPGGFSQPFVMMGRINEQAAQHPIICTVGGEKENDAADKLLIQRQRISVCA